MGASVGCHEAIAILVCARSLLVHTGRAEHASRSSTFGHREHQPRSTRRLDDALACAALIARHGVQVLNLLSSRGPRHLVQIPWAIASFSRRMVLIESHMRRALSVLTSRHATCWVHHCNHWVHHSPVRLQSIGALV